MESKKGIVIKKITKQPTGKLSTTPSIPEKEQKQELTTKAGNFLTNPIKEQMKQPTGKTNTTPTITIKENTNQPTGKNYSTLTVPIKEQTKQPTGKTNSTLNVPIKEKTKQPTGKTNSTLNVPIKDEAIHSNGKSSNILINEVTKQTELMTLDNPNKTPVHNLKRANSKKQKLPVVVDRSQHSKESEVLKILKKSNSSLEDQNLIDKCLQKNLFMRNLEKQARIEVIKQMNYCYVTKNTVIFEQGSVGNYFYILKEGKVSLYINDEFKKFLVAGDSFGDLALLHGATRSGTIKAEEDTYMWCLERKKFKQIVDYIANKNFEENKSFIKSIPMFKDMDTNFITRLSTSMISVIYDSGTYIIKDGESSDCMYIIREGTVVCSKNEKVFRNFTKGDSFGFMSILTDSPRTMNVIAKSTCELYSISVATLIDLLGKNFKDTLYLNFIKIAMSKSKYFNKINPHLLELAYNSFKPTKYDKNSIVYQKGTAMDEKIIIILEGMLVKNTSKNNNTLESDEKRVHLAERGTILYEEHLFSTDVNNRLIIDYDIYADPDCLLMEANLIDFVKLLGGSFHELTERSNLIESLSKVPLFKDFPMTKIKSIAEHIIIEHFKNSQKIIQEGEEGSKFYIVKSGKVDIYIKNNYLRSLNDFDFFGERSLFIQEPRSATAIANGPVSLYSLSKEHFMKIIDENFKQHILERVSLQDNTIELSDLDYVQNLGSGNFGNVYLVNSRKKNRLYALKTVSKNQIDQEQLHGNLEMERKILLQIDHPFIMKLVKSLKDEQDVYFLMEFVRGKELWDVIREIGVMNKSQTLFYGCSLFLALNYLHCRRFVYRDIKPENAMVTDKVNLI
jgi:cGMP-dependent protein kinase 1